MFVVDKCHVFSWKGRKMNSAKQAVHVLKLGSVFAVLSSKPLFVSCTSFYCYVVNLIVTSAK